MRGEKQLHLHGFAPMNTDLNEFSDSCSSAFIRGKEFAFFAVFFLSPCLRDKKFNE